jgi:hypothetical protein
MESGHREFVAHLEDRAAVDKALDRYNGIAERSAAEGGRKRHYEAEPSGHGWDVYVVIGE